MTLPIEKPPIYEYISKNDYGSAEICLKNMDEKDIPLLYGNSTTKIPNTVHLLIQKDTTKSQELLSKIIEKSQQHLEDFQKTSPFSFSLEQKKNDVFRYLVTQYFHLLSEEETSECLKQIAQNNLTFSNKILTPKLTEKNIPLLFKDPSSSLWIAIQKNHLQIFDLFLSKITELNGKKQNFISSLSSNKRNIVHIISEQKHGVSFLERLWNQKQPETSEKGSNLFYIDEIIQQINSKDPEGNTPLSLAAKTDNVLLVRKLLQFGADPNLHSKHGKPREIKEISPSVKKILFEAECGLVDEVENCPVSLFEKFRERKENGLIKCCKEGDLDNAKKLIDTYKIDSFKKDDKLNSLVMIMLNHDVPEKTIIEFIKFLVEKKALNFKHTNVDQDNLLTLSLSKNKPEVAFHLIQNHGADLDLNHVNSKNSTALTLAASNEFFKVITALSKFSNEVDLTISKQGWTALNSLNQYVISNKKPQIETEKEKEKKPQGFQIRPDSSSFGFKPASFGFGSMLEQPSSENLKIFSSFGINK